MLGFTWLLYTVQSTGYFAVTVGQQEIAYLLLCLLSWLPHKAGIWGSKTVMCLLSFLGVAK